MYSKSLLRISAILILLMAMLSLNGCNVSGTKMEISFNRSTPVNSSDEKIFYANNDIDKLTLNADLKMDSGEAIIQVLNTHNGDVIWSESYENDSDFKIELVDIKAGSEYLLKINTIQSQKVNLIVTSDDKLVKNKELVSFSNNTSEKMSDYTAFLDLLTQNGFQYVEDVADTDSFLSVERKPIFIGDEIVSIYEYSSNDEMENDSKYIDKDGSGISTPEKEVKISWISIPHFFKKDTLIINYVGENESILNLLKDNYGDEFAGYEFNK